MQVSRGLAGAVALVLLNGCKDYPKVAPGPIVQQQNVAGALPPSASDTAGTGFYDFMETLTWSPKKEVEMCTNSLFCRVGLSGKVKVDLQVPDSSYLADPRNINPAGVLLVRAFNKGNKPTGNYEFQPGYIYALVAYPDSPGATTSHWVLKQIDSTTHLTTTVKGVAGPYHPCDDAPPAITDDVGLYECGEPHRSAAAVKMGMFGFIENVSAALAAMMAAESPVWKSCPSGCCTLATS